MKFVIKNKIKIKKSSKRQIKHIPAYYNQFIYYFALKVIDQIGHIIKSANASCKTVKKIS